MSQLKKTPQKDYDADMRLAESLSTIDALHRQVDALQQDNTMLHHQVTKYKIIVGQLNEMAQIMQPKAQGQVQQTIDSIENVLRTHVSHDKILIIIDIIKGIFKLNEFNVVDKTAPTLTPASPSPLPLYYKTPPQTPKRSPNRM